MTNSILIIIMGIMNITDVNIIQRFSGLSDQQMAEEIGISREYYNRIKNGRQKLTAKVIVKIMEEFKEIFLQHNIAIVININGKPLHIIELGE